MFRLARSVRSNELALAEAQWVLRAREGHEQSMRLLIERHRNRLVRTASNILRDANEAEDVTQEAFLKAFRELDRLRDDQAFSGYVYRICVRLCMDRLRARRAEPSEFEAVTEDQGENIENRVVIERLLDRLPYDLRTTLVLREVEQLSYDEIAEAMRVPVGTVRSRLHAARERFRALWMEANG
ncbi:MAG: sigma-70 family RNA polymerase sigma factor [Fimbriimonadales bacterium]|nr:sigma-70 family RNA polymerase sigma factor [Fimbriimonadales bacterium]